LLLSTIIESFIALFIGTSPKEALSKLRIFPTPDLYNSLYEKSAPNASSLSPVLAITEDLP
jgi:hypothetical protein